MTTRLQCKNCLCLGWKSGEQPAKCGQVGSENHAHPKKKYATVTLIWPQPQAKDIEMEEKTTGRNLRLCPVCKWDDGALDGLNVHITTWGVCHKCKLKWVIGSNLMTPKGENWKVWRANSRLLDLYECREPFRPNPQAIQEPEFGFLRESEHGTLDGLQIHIPETMESTWDGCSLTIETPNAEQIQRLYKLFSDLTSALALERRDPFAPIDGCQ